MSELTKEQIEEIVEAAVARAMEAANKKAVIDTLILMGVNAGDNKSLLDMQKDFNYLREARTGREEFIAKSKLALIGVFLTGAAAILVKGFIAWIKTQGI